MILWFFLSRGKVYLTASPAAEAALAIIQAGATKVQEVFYPWWLQYTCSLWVLFPCHRNQVLQSYYNYSSPWRLHSLSLLSCTTPLLIIVTPVPLSIPVNHHYQLGARQQWWKSKLSSFHKTLLELPFILWGAKTCGFLSQPHCPVPASVHAKLQHGWHRWIWSWECFLSDLGKVCVCFFIPTVPIPSLEGLNPLACSSFPHPSVFSICFLSPRCSYLAPLLTIVPSRRNSSVWKPCKAGY